VRPAEKDEKRDKRTETEEVEYRPGELSNETRSNSAMSNDTACSRYSPQKLVLRNKLEQEGEGGEERAEEGTVKISLFVLRYRETEHRLKH